MPTSSARLGHQGEPVGEVVPTATSLVVVAARTEQLGNTIDLSPQPTRPVTRREDASSATQLGSAQVGQVNLAPIRSSPFSTRYVKPCRVSGVRWSRGSM